LLEVDKVFGNTLMMTTYTVACESIHPPWHFYYFVALHLGIKIDFGGFVSFDLHNMPTTSEMQNIFYCETNKK
jgi:hypothetical protein